MRIISKMADDKARFKTLCISFLQWICGKSRLTDYQEELRNAFKKNMEILNDNSYERLGVNNKFLVDIIGAFLSTLPEEERAEVPKLIMFLYAYQKTHY